MTVSQESVFLCDLQTNHADLVNFLCKTLPSSPSKYSLPSFPNPDLQRNLRTFEMMTWVFPALILYTQISIYMLDPLICLNVHKHS